MSSIILSLISSTHIYVVNYIVIYLIKSDLLSKLSTFISSSQMYVVNFIVIYLINSDLCRQFYRHLSHQLRLYVVNLE